jgi:hypothetical protein
MISNEKVATVAVTASAVLLAAAAAAFAAAGGPVLAPSADELPSIATERPVGNDGTLPDLWERQTTLTRSGSAGPSSSASGTAGAGTVATGLGEAPASGATSEPGAPKGKALGTLKTPEPKGDDHEVVKPEPRESDDDEPDSDQEKKKPEDPPEISDEAPKTPSSDD